MALLFPIVILAVFAVLFAQHRGRDARARRYLERVEADLSPDAGPAQGAVDAGAVPRLPHHLQHVIAAAYAAQHTPAAGPAARQALAAIAEYREFRGWRCKTGTDR